MKMGAKYLVGIGILIIMVFVGCATQRFMPKDSQLVGFYTGFFSGDLPTAHGRLTIWLHETPEGEKLFRGRFVSDARGGGGLLVWGTVKDNKLEGEVQNPSHGSVSGQVSEDGNKISGSYDCDIFKTGTWEAEKT